MIGAEQGAEKADRSYVPQISVDPISGSRGMIAGSGKASRTGHFFVLVITFPASPFHDRPECSSEAWTSALPALVNWLGYTLHNRTLTEMSLIFTIFALVFATQLISWIGQNVLLELV